MRHPAFRPCTGRVGLVATLAFLAFGLPHPLAAETAAETDARHRANQAAKDAEYLRNAHLYGRGEGPSGTGTTPAAEPERPQPRTLTVEESEALDQHKRTRHQRETARLRAQRAELLEKRREWWERFQEARLPLDDCRPGSPEAAEVLRALRQEFANTAALKAAEAWWRIEGIHVARDQVAGFAALKQAVERDEQDQALVPYAWCLEQGIGCRASTWSARAHYRAALACGAAKPEIAHHRLGALAETDHHPDRFATAIHHYREADRLAGPGGDAPSRRRLAELQRDGLGMPADPAAAAAALAELDRETDTRPLIWLTADELARVADRSDDERGWAARVAAAERGHVASMRLVADRLADASRAGHDPAAAQAWRARADEVEAARLTEARLEAELATVDPTVRDCVRACRRLLDEEDPSLLQQAVIDYARAKPIQPGQVPDEHHEAFALVSDAAAAGSLAAQQLLERHYGRIRSGR